MFIILTLFLAVPLQPWQPYSAERDPVPRYLLKYYESSAPPPILKSPHHPQSL